MRYREGHSHKQNIQRFMEYIHNPHCIAIAIFKIQNEHSELRTKLNYRLKRPKMLISWITWILMDSESVAVDFFRAHHMLCYILISHRTFLHWLTLMSMLIVVNQRRKKTPSKWFFNRSSSSKSQLDKKKIEKFAWNNVATVRKIYHFSYTILVKS